MAYIGRQNLGGAYRQLDDISSGFDGSDTTHTMQVNSANVTVGDVNQIILSLGGVIQKPGTDFTVSGSVLTFTTAPAANTSFFAVLLGSDNGGTVTPTDGSVTGDKIASNAAITTTGAANFNGGITMGGTTPTLTIGDAGAEDTKIVFDGNAQDFYIGLDDSVDDLVIGVGSTVGNNEAISITDGRAVTIGAANTASSIAGVTFYVGQSGSIYTTDVSGTDDSAENNTAFGTGAMDAITTGDNNVAMGEHALGALNTGADNVAIGYNAGSSATTGSYAVMIGRNAGAANNSRLTAVGYYAGAASTGIGGTYMGFNAGSGNTSGTYNTALGYNALYQPDEEGYNIAIGVAALGGPIAGGENNVAIGGNALDALTAGDHNIAIGHDASTNATTAVNTVAIGRLALRDMTTAGGASVGYSIGIGSYGMYNAVDNGPNIGIGGFSSASATNGTQQIVLGYNVTGSGDNTFTFGAGSTDTTCSHGATSFSAPSDERWKKDIETSTCGLSFINDLRPVSFKFKTKGELDSSLHDYEKDSTEAAGFTSNSVLGFVAQEVKTVIDNHSEFKGSELWKEGIDKYNKRQRISKEALIPILVKAIQELSAKVKTLEDA